MPPSCRSNSSTANTSNEDNSSIMSSTTTISSSSSSSSGNNKSNNKMITKDKQASGKPSGNNQTGSNKTKPSYKHVPHSQKPAHLVAKRNARERRRVQAVNQAFYKLRKCVPIENRNKRVSKVKTLQRAIDYIRKLERILAEDDESVALNGSLDHHQPVVSTTASLCSPATHQQGESCALKLCDRSQLIDSRKSTPKRAAAETSGKQKRGRKPNPAKAAYLQQQQQQQQQQLPPQEPLQPVATQVVANHTELTSSCVGYPLDDMQKYPQISSLTSGTTGSHFDHFSVPHHQHQQQPHYTGSVGYNQYSSTESVLRESSVCNISPIYHQQHHQNQYNHNHQPYHQEYPSQQQQPYLGGGVGSYVGAADYLACEERGYPSSSVGSSSYNAASFYQQQQTGGAGFSPLAESHPSAYLTMLGQQETDHNWSAAKQQQPLDSSTSPPPELTVPSFLANNNSSSSSNGGGDNSSTVVCRPVRPPVDCSTTATARNAATQVTSSPASISVQQVNSGYPAYAPTTPTHLSSVVASSSAAQSPFAVNSSTAAASDAAAAAYLHSSLPQSAAATAAASSSSSSSSQAVRLPHQTDGIANSSNGDGEQQSSVAAVGGRDNSKLLNNEAAVQVTRTSHQHHNHNHNHHHHHHSHHHQPMQQRQPHVQVRHLLSGGGGGGTASLSANNNLHV